MSEANAPTARDIFNAGDRFRGYVVERLLGKGGLGAVYLVRHEVLETPYALKVLYPDVAASNRHYVKRFLREAKIATRIRHPNLVAVHDAGLDEQHGLYYIVMDWVSGGDLRQAIAFAGHFDPDRAVEVVMQVASALEAAHKFKVVHRDIKPENIMLERDGRVKLVDLGVAKVRNTDSLRTMPNTVFGTPNYISPEQAQDSSTVDGRADVYSLGVVLFELLCGRRPYECEKPNDVVRQLLSEKPVPDVRDFKPDVPLQLAVVLRLMLAKKPEERLGSASAFLERLEEVGYGEALDDAPSVVCSSSSSSTAASSDNFSYTALSSAKENRTLSFDTKDEEISGFIKDLKARRRRMAIVRRVALSAVVGTVIVLALVLFFST